MNVVSLIGNVGQDPEKYMTQDGKLVVKFSLATGYKNHTDWHQIAVFGKAAEICLRYVKKGHKLGVSGQINYNKYKTKDGETRYGVQINSRDITLCNNQNREEETGIQNEEDIPF
jgi:single-strand DNA-binding protein